MANTIKFSCKSMKVIGHQGLYGLEAGNTCQAFIAAGNRESYFGIETDVHRTVDGKYIVMHDDNTRNLSAHGEALEIKDSTFEELRAICLKDKDGSRDRIDIRIPTLAEYIKICKYYDKKAILEIKNPMEPQYVREVVDIIREMDYLSGTIFISFHRENLTALREYLPEQPLQYLTIEWNSDICDFCVKNNIDLDLRWFALTQEVFDDVKKHGLKVNIWSLDDPATAEMYDSMGVDFMTTNILEAKY